MNVELGYGDERVGPDDVRYVHRTSLGDVTLRATYDDEGNVATLIVEEAAPRVLISGKLLRQLAAGEGHDRTPRATVDNPWVGGVLRIEADNATLVYRITTYAPALDGVVIPDAFIGEWPD